MFDYRVKVSNFKHYIKYFMIPHQENQNIVLPTLRNFLGGGGRGGGTLCVGDQWGSVKMKGATELVTQPSHQATQAPPIDAM